MHLRDVEVRNWRGLEHRSLSDLSEGLNLIVGPNEAGKSRLFEAIRFGLFESHKGTASYKQALQSWNSQEVPWVRLAFEHDGHQYELEKRFLKQPIAQLTGGGERLTGEDAEDRLRAMLGTRPASNRGAAVADLGIWPLLMVAQGDSRTPVAEHLNEDGRSRLHACLSVTIGEAAIGAEGQKLLDRIEAEYARYFTPRSGQLAQSAKLASERLERATAELADAQKRLAAQQTVADELARKREVLADLRSRLGPLEQTDKDAAARAADAAKVEGQLRQAVATLQLAENAQREADRLVAVRTEADQDASVAQAALEDLWKDQQAAAAALAEARQAQSEASERLAQAREAVRIANGNVAAARKAGQAAELDQQAKELDKLITRLAELEQRRRADERALAAKPAITRADVAALRNARDKAATARAKVQGAAVSVDIIAHQPLRVDGVAVPAGERRSLRVTSNQSIELGEIATIVVAPGGGELGKLQAAADKDERALADLLGEHGVASVEQAEQIAREIEEIEQRVAGLKDQAAALSDTSVEDLRRAREDLGERIEALGQTGDAASLDAALAAAEQAQSLADEATTASGAANAEVANCEAAAALLTQSVSVQEARLLAAQGRVAALASAEELQAAAQAAARAVTAAREAHAGLQKAFAEGGYERAAEDAAAAKRAVDAMTGRIDQARTAVATATGELQAAMRDAPFESVQDKLSEVALAQAEADRVARDAGAAKLLRETLVAARREVVERLTAPVVERVRPHLADIFPGSTLDVGEDLSFNGLQTGVIAEPFGALSGGAQEQVSLLTRIGLAEVLANGARLPLLLDDTLVNTDAARMRQIQRVLYRVAQSGLQVLLFSCHDSLFDALGADRTIALSGTRA